MGDCPQEVLLPETQLTALASAEDDLAWLLAESELVLGQDGWWSFVENYASNDLRVVIREKRASNLKLEQPNHLVRLDPEHQNLWKRRFHEAREKLSRGFRREHMQQVLPPPDGISAASTASLDVDGEPYDSEDTESSDGDKVKYQHNAEGKAAEATETYAATVNHQVQNPSRKSNEMTLTDAEEELARLAEESRLLSSSDRVRIKCDWDWIEDNASCDVTELLNSVKEEHRHKFNVLVAHCRLKVFRDRREEISKDLLKQKGAEFAWFEAYDSEDTVSNGGDKDKYKHNAEGKAAEADTISAAPPNHQVQHSKRKSNQMTLTDAEEELAGLAEESRLLSSSGRVRKTCDWHWIEDNASCEVMELLNSVRDEHRHKFRYLVAYSRHKIFKDRRGEILKHLLKQKGEEFEAYGSAEESKDSSKYTESNDGGKDQDHHKTEGKAAEATEISAAPPNHQGQISKRKSNQMTLTDAEEELARLAEESRLLSSSGHVQMTCDWDWIEDNASCAVMELLNSVKEEHRHKFNVLVAYCRLKAFKDRREEISKDLLTEKGAEFKDHSASERKQKREANSENTSFNRKQRWVGIHANKAPAWSDSSNGASSKSPRSSNSTRRSSLKLNSFEEEILMLGERSRLVYGTKNYNWGYIKTHASQSLLDEMERKRVFDETAAGGSKIDRITRVHLQNFRKVFKKRRTMLRKSLLPSEEIKDKLDIGSSVYALFMGKYYPGKVENYSETSGCRRYDIDFDDGDKATNMDEVHVIKECDYDLWMNRFNKGHKKGIMHYCDPSKDASDWNSKRGWWQTELNGEEKFGSVSAAMRAYDNAFVQKNGSRTRREDLNLPDEFDFSSTRGPLRHSFEDSTPTSTQHSSARDESCHNRSDVASAAETPPPSRLHYMNSSPDQASNTAKDNAATMEENSRQAAHGSLHGNADGSRARAANGSLLEEFDFSPIEGPSRHSFENSTPTSTQPNSARDGSCHNRPDAASTVEAPPASRLHYIETSPDQASNITEDNATTMGENSRQASHGSFHGNADQTGGPHHRALDVLKRSHALQIERLRSEQQNIEEESRRYLGELETLLGNMGGNDGNALQRSLLIEDVNETHKLHLERLNEQQRRFLDEHRRYMENTKQKFSRFLQSIESQEPS